MEKITKFSELLPYLQKLIEGISDPEVEYEGSTDSYGKCAVAMGMAGAAVVDLMGYQVGSTGFQHGYASMYALKLLRNIDGPFIIIQADEELGGSGRVEDSLLEWLSNKGTIQYLAEKAQEKLDSHENHKKEKPELYVDDDDSTSDYYNNLKFLASRKVTDETVS